MRRTLIEVLGESLYTMDWLERRVRYHLDPLQCTGQIFLSVLPSGERLGYTIVRREEATLGLFSTTYVEPEWRRRGVAQALLQRGQEWMRELGLARAATYTAEANTRLHQLYLNNGYALFPSQNGFVKLIKEL
ncbi:MAG: GNAT family N-acetyltransferase [Candidatus Eremiobacteraeota bacterium]|nr:GNAT family N-acetyltransferase [Candidatus Eremiobacteraeota bacterium]MCW5867337.1 GNAT family N-acetyltransferase [Candidatus Eremiobacteraeota bacterium]